MKLATIPSANQSQRDGELILVSRDQKTACRASNISPTLLHATQHWDEVSPKLEATYRALNEGTAPGSFAFEIEQCLAPLPNAPGFYDGSAFLSHVQRARAARGDKMPESARLTPLMYQGVSDNLLGPKTPLKLQDASFGGDFEAEFAVITKDIPCGTPAEKISPYLILFSLFNDITHREIVKTEIVTKFGFLQSKPNSSFAPIVVTRDELGDAWKDGRIHLDVQVRLNDEVFGRPNGKEMNFSFEQLVAHAGRTRPLSGGNIIGTGTVSNEDKARGFGCLTEKRYQEVMDTGSASTPWLKEGDRVFMDVEHEGQSLFGCIDQKVTL